MTFEDLKKDETVFRFLSPMPRPVKEKIENESFYPCANRYVAFLEKFGDEVIYRVWAFKKTKTYGLQTREVMRSILGEKGLIYRDMYLNYMGGYKVIYKASNGSSSSWYGYSYYAYDESDFGKWAWTDKIGVGVEVINKELLEDTKFKYSGYNGMSSLLKWMEIYSEYPQVEFLGKLGFEPSKKLLKKAAKDKAFCKYLAKVEKPNNNINAICYAYDHDMSIEEAGRILMERQELGRKFRGCPEIKKAGIDLNKAYKYIYSQKNCSVPSYEDYIIACVGLKLDLKDTKNAFPKDFKRMHDTRVAQWKVKKNKTKKKDFAKAAEKYLQFEMQGENYSIIIPHNINDLAFEGASLHHCVADMGYDGKMIAGTSFIAFVRKNKSLKDPFVTVEFSVEQKSVLQIHGEYNSTPEKEVRDFVAAWGKKVSKEMRKKKCITA